MTIDVDLVGKLETLQRAQINLKDAQDRAAQLQQRMCAEVEAADRRYSEAVEAVFSAAAERKAAIDFAVQRVVEGSGAVTLSAPEPEPELGPLPLTDGPVQ